jgi:hypothetical protein
MGVFARRQLEPRATLVVTLSVMLHRSLEEALEDLAQRFAREVIVLLRGFSLEEIVAVAPNHDRVPRRGPGRPRKIHTPSAGVRKSVNTEDEARELLQRQGYRLRRSPARLKKLANQIVAVVKSHPDGIDAKGIKAALGFKSGMAAQKVFSTPLNMALASKTIQKTGVAVNTIYTATPRPDSTRNRTAREHKPVGLSGDASRSDEQSVPNQEQMTRADGHDAIQEISRNAISTIPS